MVRIMIVLLLAGSAVLGWLGYQQQKVIDRYEAAVQEGGEVETLAEDILKRGFQYTAYKERSAKEGVKGNGADSVQTYVYEIARRRAVLWGNPTISKPRTTGNLKGYSDTNYAVSSKEKGVAFERAQIANFFYLIEQESRKMRVTSLDVRCASTKTKPHEIPEDRWTADFTLCVRERDGK